MFHDFSGCLQQIQAKWSNKWMLLAGYSFLDRTTSYHFSNIKDKEKCHMQYSSVVRKAHIVQVPSLFFLSKLLPQNLDSYPHVDFNIFLSVQLKCIIINMNAVRISAQSLHALQSTNLLHDQLSTA